MPNIPVSKRVALGRPCLTCQQRKIKCDRGKPACERCRKARFQCDGYPVENFVLVVPTTKNNGNSSKVTLRRVRKNNTAQVAPPPSTAAVTSAVLTENIDMAPENRMQVLSYFLEKYIPAYLNSYRSFETPSSWIRGLPNLLGRWELLDTALTALCLAYIGDSHHEEATLQESQRYYSSVLRQLGSLSLESIKSSNEGVLATTMIMAMYELFHCTYRGLHGWMFHVKGACRLLELRGPPSPELPLNISLYSRVRTTAIWDAYGTRKAMFLARPEWQGLSNSPHDLLLDLLTYLPGLLEQSDVILAAAEEPRHPRSSKVDLPAVDDLLSCWHAIHHRLTNWYSDFEAQEPAGLFKSGPLQPGTHPYLDPDRPDLQSVFPQIITFQDTYIAQLMLSYWFGEVIVYTAMTRIYDIKEPHRGVFSASVVSENCKTPYHEKKQRTKEVGEYYATKICQSIAGLQGGFGFQIAMVPLWAAQQFFDVCSDPRFYWCQTVLKNFGKVGGFVLAAALGTLTPTQYPGRTLRAKQ